MISNLLDMAVQIAAQVGETTGVIGLQSKTHGMLFSGRFGACAALLLVGQIDLDMMVDQYACDASMMTPRRLFG